MRRGRAFGDWRMAGGEGAVVGGPLRMEPSEAAFSAPAFVGAPVTSKHRISNTGKDRLGLKIKCTDNAAYKVDQPGLTSLEAGRELGLTITRQPVPDKRDKLVVQCIALRPDQDSATAWRTRTEPPDGELTLYLTARGVSKHKSAAKAGDVGGDNSEDLTWEELKERMGRAADDRLSRPMAKDAGELGVELELRRGTCHQGLLSRWVAELQLKRKPGSSWLLASSWAKGQSGWDLVLHSLKEEKHSRAPLRPRPDDGSFDEAGNVLGLLMKKNRDGALGRLLERPQRLLLRSQLSPEPAKLLGKGSFGAVHLYQFQPTAEPKDKRALAVKTPTNQGTQKAFLEECFLSMKAGGHEAVVDYVGVFGLGMDGGQLGLGMEHRYHFAKTAKRMGTAAAYIVGWYERTTAASSLLSVAFGARVPRSH